MSSQESKEPRTESADDEVIAHINVVEEIDDVDPERKRKRVRRASEDADLDELGRKRK